MQYRHTSPSCFLFSFLGWCFLSSATLMLLFPVSLFGSFFFSSLSGLLWGLIHDLHLQSSWQLVQICPELSLFSVLQTAVSLPLFNHARRHFTFGICSWGIRYIVHQTPLADKVPFTVTASSSQSPRWWFLYLFASVSTQLQNLVDLTVILVMNSATVSVFSPLLPLFRL